MSTQNRRVATYLPKDIDEMFQAFKTERGIDGDSKALLVILSEFLGVSQKVGHEVDYSSFATQSQLNDVLSKLSALSDSVSKSDSLSSLLSGLSERLHSLENRIDRFENKSSILTPQIETVPGQLGLPLEPVTPSDLGEKIPDQPDGQRWLTMNQAYQIACDKGYKRTFETFRKWAVDHPKQCLESYGLQKLPSSGKGSNKPAFEHVGLGFDDF